MFVGLPNISKIILKVLYEAAMIPYLYFHTNLEPTTPLSISYWIKFEVHWT